MKSALGHGPSGPELGLITAWKVTEGFAFAASKSGSQAPGRGYMYRGRRMKAWLTMVRKGSSSRAESD